MKTISSLTVIGLMLVLALGLVAAQSGSIWTTTESCGEDPQNANEYFAGQIVYINGANFDEGTYAWDIAASPFKVEDQVAFGNVVVDASGKFCFPAYTILEQDSGVYQATVDKTKKDNYHIGTPMVPEFGTTIGIATALGALGVFFLVRRK